MKLLATLNGDSSIHMNNLGTKVILLFFIKNFINTAYILPIWFISIVIFEHVSTYDLGFLSKDVVLFLFDSAGFIFFILLLVGCYYWSCITYANFTYELQPDGLHVHNGVIIRRHRVIPYRDIASVEILANPFVVHFLDLYTLRIKTREIDNTEGLLRGEQIQLIPGLSSEIARVLRSELLKNSHLLEL